MPQTKVNVLKKRSLLASTLQHRGVVREIGPYSRKESGVVMLRDVVLREDFSASRRLHFLELFLLFWFLNTTLPSNMWMRG
ncbi:hypothetical protein Csa_006606 [Cucumis sativus]|uniref:Uncharacterized protein n=1 Tax=Cucumis sativus TaxID=3659 RepID=A0A0A0LMP9_CUCSA|nr:hypothetical protein Csa_006606 [Cucumis sativus]